MLGSPAVSLGNAAKPSAGLEAEIQRLLGSLAGLDSIRKLFWELLSYDQRAEAASLSGMAPELRSHVDQAQLFASHSQFHVYYTTISADSMTMPLIRQVYRHFRRKHRFAALLVGNAVQCEWRLVYQSDELTSPRGKCPARIIALGHRDANHRLQARSLAKLKTYDDTDEPRSLLELTLAYEGVFRKDASAFGASVRAKDGIELLLAEIGRYPLLNAREERSILERLGAASTQVNVCKGKRTKRVRIAVEGREVEFEDLRRKLVVHNLRLCFYLAKRYATNQDELLDLFQESVLGLHRAIDLVEPKRNLRFSTYAYQWVRQAITRWTINSRPLIRIPAHVYERPTPERPFIHIVSLDHGNPTALLATSDDLRDSLDSSLDREQMIDVLAICLRSLNERHAGILERRFGLNGSEKQTLEQIGKTYGLTRERIRQLELKAMTKLGFHLRRSVPRITDNRNKDAHH
jgi:RNA polymerase primary sigma factor